MIQISMKFVHNGPINIKPNLVQVVAWRRSGIYASFGLDELASDWLCLLFTMFVIRDPLY